MQVTTVQDRDIRERAFLRVPEAGARGGGRALDAGEREAVPSRTLPSPSGVQTELAFAHLPRPEAPPRLTEAQSRRARGLRLGTLAPHLEGRLRRPRAREGSREVRAPAPKTGGLWEM